MRILNESGYNIYFYDIIEMNANTKLTRSRNFDCLRFTAACMVVFGHSYDITIAPGTAGFLTIWSHGQIESASLALLMFFTISGYLVTGSFVNSNSVWRFCAARFLRLIPGLTVAVLLQVFVLGPLVSSASISVYFGQLQPYMTALGSISLLSVNGDLPDVFEAVPWPRSMNTPLWTLPYEVMCYGCVLVLGVCQLLRTWVLAPFFVACIIMRLLWFQGPMLVFGTAFLAGALLYQSRIPLRGWVAILCVCGLAFGIFVTGFRIGYPVCGAYLLIYLAQSPSIRLPNLSRFGDLSYGIYIYAWPIQQSVVWLWPGSNAAYNVILSLPITLILAWLSWHLIEKKALMWKPSILRSNAFRVAIHGHS